MTTEIAVIEVTPDQAPAIYVAGGLNKYFEQIKQAASSEVPDLTTKKGRERVASLAAQVSRSKTAVEKPGRDYLKRLKELPKEVEVELREWVTKCDSLRDEIRDPLTKLEQAAKEKIAVMTAMVEVTTSEEAEEAIKALVDVKFDDILPEFHKDAEKAQQAAIASLVKTKAMLEQQEEQARQLAAANAERERLEREAYERRIAEEAAQKARQEEADRQRAEREAIERKAMEDRIRAEESQRREEAAKRAEEEANRRRIEQERQAKIAAEQAKRDAEIAAQQAAERERQRQADEIAKAEAEKAAREADRQHRSSINNSALTALVAAGIDQEVGKAVLRLIASGNVPHVSINY